MIAKLFSKFKPEANPELRVKELEVWKRNRHLIWVFAVASSFFTYLSVSSYYNVKINDLKAQLQQVKSTSYVSESANSLQSEILSKGNGSK